MKSRLSQRFTVHEQVLRLVIVSLLSALGYLLMMMGKVQVYWLLPFLEIEVSDAVVLVSYSLYGFWSSLAVALIKTLLTALTFGPVGSPIPIGQITAFLTSILYSFALFIMDKGFQAFSKGFKYRILSYSFVIAFVSLIMTYLNYLFITPTFLTYGAQFLTCYDVFNNVELSQTMSQYFSAFTGSYAAIIFVAYFPFNLLKGFLVCLTYELIFNRVIYQVLKSGMLGTKVFMKADDFSRISPFTSLLKIAKEEAATKIRKERLQNKKKKKKHSSDVSFLSQISKTTYVYQLTISKSYKTETVFVNSDEKLIAFVNDYCLANYPDNDYEITSSSNLKEEKITADTTRQSQDDFFDIYQCDILIRKTIAVVIRIK
ncbi:MAG: ECF transporter S component [Bacilli bacterium]